MWWKVVSFFTSARILWVVIGLLSAFVATFYISSQSRLEKVTELKLENQLKSAIIADMEIKMDTLDAITRARQTRKEEWKQEALKWKQRFAELQEDETISAWANTPYPDSLL